MNKDAGTIAGRHSNIRALTESAILIAMATVLSMFAVFKLPNGGSVTIASMIPIIVISLRYPFVWSLSAAVVYSLIQMLQSFYAPPVENLLYYTLMVLLDYVIAYCVLSLAGPLFRLLRKKVSDRISMLAAAVICFALRFVCHFLSGIIIWESYAPEGKPVWLYSLTYNGSYMLCECIISGIVMFMLSTVILNIFMKERKAGKAAV